MADNSGDQLTDAAREQLGTLEVRSQVVVRIAEIAAAAVAGVERLSGGLTSRTLPRAEATVTSGRVRATVEAATVWPTPIADVAVRVRAAVEENVALRSGLDVESVDVRIYYTAPEQRPNTSRGVE